MCSFQAARFQGGKVGTPYPHHDCSDFNGVITLRCGKVGSTPSSYLECPSLKSWLGDALHSVRFIVVFLTLWMQFLEQYLKLQREASLIVSLKSQT